MRNPTTFRFSEEHKSIGTLISNLRLLSQLLNKFKIMAPYLIPFESTIILLTNHLRCMQLSFISNFRWLSLLLNLKIGGPRLVGGVPSLFLYSIFFLEQWTEVHPGIINFKFKTSHSINETIENWGGPQGSSYLTLFKFTIFS